MREIAGKSVKFFDIVLHIAYAVVIRVHPYEIDIFTQSEIFDYLFPVELSGKIMTGYTVIIAVFDHRAQSVDMFEHFSVTVIG